MKLRDAIFSMAIVGLLVVPVVSFAQSSGSSASFVDTLFPSMNIGSGTAAQSGALANIGVNTLPNAPIASVGTPTRSVLGSSIEMLSGVTLNHNDNNATKSIRSFDGGGSAGPVGGFGFGATATPEPGAWALMIAGFSGSLLALRRRKK